MERAASPEEREGIARALDLVACSSLIARYTLSPRSGGHFRLTGTLKAQIEQSCVVTLEPLTNEIAESFSVDYWPETEIPAARQAVSSTCTMSPIWSRSLRAASKSGASSSSAWQAPSICFRESPA